MLNLLPDSIGVPAYEPGADPGEDPVVFDLILERHDELPTSSSRTYTNARDDKTVVTVPVLRGEGELADDDENEKLAEMRLTDIEPRPAGETRFEITFTVDWEGVLTATVVNLEDLRTREKVDVVLDDEGETVDDPVGGNELQMTADDD